MKKEYYVFGAMIGIFLLLIGYESYNFSHGGHHMMMGGNHMMGSGYQQNILTRLFNPVVLAMIILIAAFLYIIIKGSKEEKGETPAIKILKERYARGEVTREEYLEIFKDIMEKE